MTAFNKKKDDSVQHDQNCEHDPQEEPGTQIPMEEAAQLVAREFRALVVKRVYLVPGNNDLCDENPRNRYRYASFVLALQRAIQKQQDERKENLDDAKKAVDKVNSEKKLTVPAVPVQPPARPEVVDLTFTLDRLHEDDPRVKALYDSLSLPEKEQYLEPRPSMPGTCSTLAGNSPLINGFCLLGLDSSYFKPHTGSNRAKQIQNDADRESAIELERLGKQIDVGSSYLLFTHIPDIQDPYRKTTESSWLIRTSARSKWMEALGRSELTAVFAGHFHTSNREIYPHNFSYANSIDPLVAQKFWLAPALAAKYQARLPESKTARGILLVDVTRRGVESVSPEADAQVQALPLWFSPLDQKPSLPADDKMAAARAVEAERKRPSGDESYYAATKGTFLGSGDCKPSPGKIAAQSLPTVLHGTTGVAILHLSNPQPTDAHPSLTAGPFFNQDTQSLIPDAKVAVTAVRGGGAAPYGAEKRREHRRGCQH